MPNLHVCGFSAPTKMSAVVEMSPVCRDNSQMLFHSQRLFERLGDNVGLPYKQSVLPSVFPILTF